MSIRTICFGILLALSGFFTPGAANAQVHHPYCIQARSDLGVARSLLLQYIDGQAMTHNEKEALRQINEIIREINEAIIDKGNGISDYPKLQEGEDKAASLRQCIEFLKKAKDDLRHEEDSQFSGDLRDRSIRNCNEAIKF